MPWTEEPGRLWSIGSQRVRHNGSDLACTRTEGKGGTPGKENSMKWALEFLHTVCKGHSGKAGLSGMKCSNNG